MKNSKKGAAVKWVFAVMVTAYVMLFLVGKFYDNDSTQPTLNEKSVQPSSQEEDINDLPDLDINLNFDWNDIQIIHLVDDYIEWEYYPSSPPVDFGNEERLLL